MKLLITGVAGFIGSSLAKTALKNGYEVVGVDNLSQGYLKNVPTGAQFFRLDLAHAVNISNLPKDIDYILHLAGQSSGEISFENPAIDLEKNVATTLNLIRFGIENKVKKMVYASSMSVYGTTTDCPVDELTSCSPLSCYGVGKFAAENYLKIYQKQLPYVIFRIFNTYGPGQDMNNLKQGMVSIYLAHIIKNRHIPVKGSVDRFRDFIYIDDVVDFWLKVIERPDINNEIFNLGTGVRTTVFELLAKIKEILPNFTWIEIQNTLGDQFGIYADIKKVKTFFGEYEFTPLEIGLTRFIESLENEFSLYNN